MVGTNHMSFMYKHVLATNNFFVVVCLLNLFESLN